MSLVQLSHGKIASSSENKTIKEWDFKTNFSIATPIEHTCYDFSVIQMEKYT